MANDDDNDKPLDEEEAKDQADLIQPSMVYPRLFMGAYGHAGLILIGLFSFIDLYTKYFLLEIYQLSGRGFVSIAPGFDIVLSKNPGISFGLFPQGSAWGTGVLVTFNIVVTLGLVWWLIRTDSRWIFLGASLLAGGAIGNGVDRMVTGAVTDFIFFHIGSFEWYVFNFADVWIFLGALLILMDNVLVARSHGGSVEF